MNKKFLLNIMMILSLVIVISCKSNSEPSDPNNNNETKQQTVTIKKSDIISGIQAKGTVGTAGDKASGKYNFSVIESIADGKTTPETITGTEAQNSTSKSKTAELMTKTFQDSEFTVEGVDIQADVSAIKSATGANAANLVLTITPAAETKEKKYVFADDLTSALSEGKLTIKIAPTSDASWGE